jgi:hypothetical protein
VKLWAREGWYPTNIEVVETMVATPRSIDCDLQRTTFRWSCGIRNFNCDELTYVHVIQDLNECLMCGSQMRRCIGHLGRKWGIPRVDRMRLNRPLYSFT